jgi:hypothetical protein
LPKGATSPPTSRDLDTIIMFIEGGQIRSLDVDGKSKTASRSFGDAVFVPKGRQVSDTMLSDGAAHEVVIALKDFRGPTYANSSGYPAAFPRPNSVKVFENDRAVVWQYSWTPSVPTPIHFHDKDIVVAYRLDGDLKSVTPDGASIVNPYKTGDIRFNKGNRSHYEVLTTAQQSAMMTELK